MVDGRWTRRDRKSGLMVAELGFVRFKRVCGALALRNGL